MATQNPTTLNTTTVQQAENAVLVDELHKVLPGVRHDLGSVDGQTVTVLELPEGRTLESVKEYVDGFRLKPQRRTGRACFDDQDSFVEHVNRFKAPSAAIFAKSGIDSDGPNAKLTAVLNYHSADDTSKNDHRSIYECPISSEWKAWTAKSGRPMSMRDFARHLEDNIQDIGTPTRALEKANDFAEKLGVEFAAANRLMGVARELTVKGDRTVTNAVSIQSGETTLHFEERHLDKNGQPIAVPAAFFVEIPVLLGGKRYQLPARLRYQVDGGKITFWYDLYRTDLTWDAAISTVLAEVKAATSLPVWLGSPE